jgi:cephalosporin hydroxylase
VLEQLDALYNITTLYEIANIYISAVDDTERQTEIQKLRSIVSEKYPKIQFTNVFSTNLYEYPGIKTVYELSNENEDEYILYFHSKGMTSNQHDIRNVLFKYTIQNYEQYINEMELNKEIDVGSLIPCANGFGYYNFFWARSSYVNKYCIKPDFSETFLKHGRFTWEMWLGNHYSNKNFIKTYSPFFKYNQVYQERQASQLMNMFLYNQFDSINTLSDTTEFKKTIQLCHKPMNDYADNGLTDKNTAHSYFDTYEKLFENIQYNSKNVLEVGIYWGGSIQLWRDYFINAHIYAVDICHIDFIKKDTIKNDHHITLFTNTNGYDDEFIKTNFINKDIKFDMILDDGPHSLQSNIDFIVKYAPLLTENGIMVIEDIQDFGYIEILKQCVPDELKPCIEVYDLRHIKNRYDDVLFVINKNSFNLSHT